jgi:hypothetical protein
MADDVIPERYILGIKNVGSMSSIVGIYLIQYNY